MFISFWKDKRDRNFHKFIRKLEKTIKDFNKLEFPATKLQEAINELVCNMGNDVKKLRDTLSSLINRCRLFESIIMTALPLLKEKAKKYLYEIHGNL